MAGSEMMTMDALTVAESMPSVVLDSATHLYRPPGASAGIWPFADSPTRLFPSR